MFFYTVKKRTADVFLVWETNKENKERFYFYFTRDVLLDFFKTAHNYKHRKKVALERFNLGP